MYTSFEEQTVGNRYKHKLLSAEKLLNLPTPILLCAGWHLYELAISNAGYKTISLNLSLAKALINIQESEIPSVITIKILNLLPNGQSIYLTDYEILFDPRYKLNVMKLFCEIARHHKLIIKWCGKNERDILVYSEPGYSDYIVYNESDYNITCVT